MDGNTSEENNLREWNLRDVMPVSRENDPEPEKPEVPRKITFAIDDWCKGTSKITAARAGFRRVVNCEKGDYLFFHVDEQIRRMILPSEFTALVSFLFDRCGFENWDAEYRAPDVLDGTRWRIIVTFDHRPEIVRRGSNAFPPCWQEVCAVFKELALGKES